MWFLDSFHHKQPGRTPKELEPLERLRRYVELKYGKIVVQKKKIVEKKS
jgi:hypothetical protein